MKQLFMFIITITTLFAEQLPIAVNDLDGNGLGENELAIISERLRSELFKTGEFTVMERGEMQLILQEQEFQMSGVCDEASCIVEVGQLLGVSKIVAGTVGKLDDFFTISIRIIDVKTGKIDASADHDYTGSISGMISSGIAAVSQKLIGAGDSVSYDKVKEVEKIEVPSKINIKSTPEGATLSIAELTEKTPFDGTLLPGKYKLNLSLEGYRNFSDKITIESNIDFSQTFTMSKKRERRRGTITRIISGSVSVAAFGAGVFFNSKANKYAQDAQGISESAASSLNGDEQNDAYQDALANSDRFSAYRNISYITSATSATLFAVSFVF
jgi:hypothetical protein